jgi:RNA polymerase sigma factor (sigma-70 family)
MADQALSPGAGAAPRGAARRRTTALAGAPNGTAALLRRCREGDDTAWAELVARYERLVFSICRREGLGVEDAADVTQTAFEALLNSLSRLRDDERVAAWLVAVARRHAWRTRDKQRNEQTLDGERDGVVVGLVEDPTGEVDTAVWLYNGLQRLGEPCRSLLTALYFEDPAPSYAQVAARLARPVGSVGPTRARCLTRLREVLREAPA